MPLTGPVSFLPVADEFSAHWNGVNAALGEGGPLRLHGAVVRETLDDLRAKMLQARASVAKIRHTRESERHDLRGIDESLEARLAQFNLHVAKLGRQAATPVEAAALWLELEKAGQGFQLPPSYDRLDFVTDLSARKLVATALAAAEKALGAARGGRDALFDQLYGFLEMYRERVQQVLPKDHELVKTLPRLGLPRGPLPEAVTAAGRWEHGSARLSWSASDEPEVTAYEVRVLPGSSYEVEDETLVERVPADGVRSVNTEMELWEPGLVASFRVYAITGSGHERGSNPVTVRRAN